MSATDQDRQARLAAALRDNLRKRKAQAREGSVAPAKAGASGGKEKPDSRGS